jgi:transposase
LTFDGDYETVLAVKARRDRLDTMIEQMAADSGFIPVVRCGSSAVGAASTP